MFMFIKIASLLIRKFQLGHIIIMSTDIKLEYCNQILNLYYAIYTVLANKAHNKELLTPKEELFFSHSWEDQHNNVINLGTMTNKHVANAIDYVYERVIGKDMRGQTTYDWSLSFLLLFNEGIKRGNIPMKLLPLSALEAVYTKLDITFTQTHQSYNQELEQYV